MSFRWLLSVASAALFKRRLCASCNGNRGSMSYGRGEGDRNNVRRWVKCSRCDGRGTVE